MEDSEDEEDEEEGGVMERPISMSPDSTSANGLELRRLRNSRSGSDMSSLYLGSVSLPGSHPGSPISRKDGSGTPVSRSPMRSRSRSLRSSRSRSRSLSRSRSRSLSSSRSLSRGVETSKIRSRSNSSIGFRLNSRSPSRSKSRSRSRSVSRSLSRSRSRSQSPLPSKLLSMTKSRSRSVSNSRSRSRSESPVNTNFKKRKAIRRDDSNDESDDDNVNRPTKNREVRRSHSEDEIDDSDDGQKSKKSKFYHESAPMPEISDSDEGVDDDKPVVKEKKNVKNTRDSSDDEGVTNDVDTSHSNDFEAMMQRKRSENKRRKKRTDIDVINDNDDAIAKLIADMRIAAKEDRELNFAGKPATRKMTMWKTVWHHLTKVDLQLAFIEANALSVMTDWLAPMPDKSLPHVVIRKNFLKLLQEIKIEDSTRLKESGIGKAVMYLYRHPKEDRDIKHLAGQIITDWARPIFHKNADYTKMSKEDRREKDNAMAARISKRGIHQDELEEPQARPGDPGWVGRARVPMVDNKEYVNRPAWQNHEAIQEGAKKKKIDLLEKHKRSFADRKRISSTQSLVKISLEGNHMKE